LYCDFGYGEEEFPGWKGEKIIKMEARIALCKCKEGKNIYGVRFEKSEDGWKYTWAFPVKEATAKREQYDKTKIMGQIVPDNGYPGCPFCRTRDFVICNCGKLNCHNGNDSHFTCNWCGLSGTLGSYDGSGFGSGGDV
jgi:hypothetical protein